MNDPDPAVAALERIRERGRPSDRLRLIAALQLVLDRTDNVSTVTRSGVTCWLLDPAQLRQAIADELTGNGGDAPTAAR